MTREGGNAQFLLLKMLITWKCPSRVVPTCDFNRKAFVKPVINHHALPLFRLYRIDTIGTTQFSHNHINISFRYKDHEWY